MIEDLPTVEQFKKDAEKVIVALASHNCWMLPFEREVATLVIAQGLLTAYIAGGNHILDNIEQKVQLMRSPSVTSA